MRGGEGDDRGERPLHERADGDDFEALVAREQDLGLVRDGGVDAAGGEQLERFGGVGGRL